MSENIESRVFHFQKKQKPTFTDERGGISGDECNEEISNVPVRSVNKAQAEVNAATVHISQTIEAPDTSRIQQAFAMQYDTVFAEFKQKLVLEYAAMRSKYISEYQNNYEQNTSRKEEKIFEVSQEIESQDGKIKEY